jgi:hypothetical protein
LLKVRWDIRRPRQLLLSHGYHAAYDAIDAEEV